MLNKATKLKRKEFASLIRDNKGEKIYHYEPNMEEGKDYDPNHYFKVISKDGKEISQIGYQIKNDRMLLINAETAPEHRNRNLIKFLEYLAEQHAKHADLSSMELDIVDHQKLKIFNSEIENQKKRETLVNEMGYRERPEKNPFTKHFEKSVRPMEPRLRTPRIKQGKVQ